MKTTGTSPKREMSGIYDIAEKMMTAKGTAGLVAITSFQAVLACFDITPDEAVSGKPNEIIKERLTGLMEIESAVLAISMLIKAGSAAMQLECDRREAAKSN